jgi:PhoH-like ATPase
MIFADTSAVLNKCANVYTDVWISHLTVAELENIKTSETKDSNIKFLARETVRDIIFHNNGYHVYYPDNKKIDKFIKKHPILSDINDHRIIAAAALLQKEKNYEVNFLTSDGAQYLAAWSVGLYATFYEKQENKEEYCGWKIIKPSDEQLAELYSHPGNNIFAAKVNEFIEIYIEDKLKDVQFWDGEKYRPLNYKEFKSALGEKIRPRNLEQKMYLDLLQNKDVPIKLCIGRFGSGKSILALNYALHEIQTGRFDKIVFVKNNLDVKGAGKLGTLPGDEIAKQLPWLRQIEDHVGVQKFEEYLETDVIEPAHLSTLRGRDLKNCVILVDEAENLLTTNIQLLLGRVAENSEIIFCADIKQCDYENEKISGIPKLIERLKGNKLFGMVKLIKAERSCVAATADLLD